MQFSPNIYAKYAAALRIYLQKRINKHGVNADIQKLLSKIILFELIVCRKKGAKTDIHYFFDKLCCAFSVELLKRHRWPTITLSGTGIGKINREAIIYFIINCKNSNDTKITIKENYIKITTDNLSNNAVIKKICYAYNYSFFKEIKKNKYGIFIPFERCENSVNKSPNEYDYLLDKLSAFRVFFQE